jgi:hypothetical protein
MITVSTAPYDPTLGSAAPTPPSSSSSSSSPSSSSSSSTATPPLITLSKRRRRVQSVELTLACQLDPESMATPNPRVVRVAPAALVRGSRYPFYAPNTPGFAADLASCVHLAVGPAVDFGTLPFDLAGMGTVLSHDVEPVAVGYIHKHHIDAAAAACLHVQQHYGAVLHAAGIVAGPMRAGWWWTTGALARVPAQVGYYRSDFGLLGSVIVRITE